MTPGIVFPKHFYLYKEPVYTIEHYYFHLPMSHSAFLLPFHPQYQVFVHTSVIHRYTHMYLSIYHCQVHVPSDFLSASVIQICTILVIAKHTPSNTHGMIL